MNLISPQKWNKRRGSIFDWRSNRKNFERKCTQGQKTSCWVSCSFWDPTESFADFKHISNRKPFSTFLISDFKTQKKLSAKIISDQRLWKQQDSRLNQQSNREQLNQTLKQAATFTLSFKCAAQVFLSSILTTILFCKHLDFSYWQ